MFRNVGKTMKVFAIILGIAFILSGVFLAIISVVSNSNVFDFEIFGQSGSTAGIIIGVAIAVGGFVLMLSMYAYGQMTENVDLIRQGTVEVVEEDDDDYDE